jgi:hypothetical protein
MSLLSGLSTDPDGGAPEDAAAVKLCNPCTKFREEAYQCRSFESIEHHTTTASFKNALRLNCAICVRLWAALKRSVLQHPGDKRLRMARTTYRCESVMKQFSRGDTIIFTFMCGGHKAHLGFKPLNGKIRRLLSAPFQDIANAARHY